MDNQIKLTDSVRPESLLGNNKTIKIVLIVSFRCDCSHTVARTECVALDNKLFEKF